MESIEDKILALLASYPCPSCGTALQSPEGPPVIPDDITKASVELASVASSQPKLRWSASTCRYAATPQKEARSSVPVSVFDLASNTVVSSGVTLRQFNRPEDIPPRVMERLSASPKTVNLVRELKGEPRVVKKKKEPQPVPTPPQPRAQPVKPEKREPWIIHTRVIPVAGTQMLVREPNSHKTGLTRKALFKS